MNTRGILGEYLMNSWETVGVDVSLVRRVEGFNGLYLMSMLQNGEREILYYRKDSAASKLTPNMLPQEALSNSRIFHTSSITQAISERDLNVLVVSTFSKDYFLVREECINTAISALRELGFPLSREESEKP